MSSASRRTAQTVSEVGSQKLNLAGDFWSTFRSCSGPNTSLVSSTSVWAGTQEPTAGGDSTMQVSLCFCCSYMFFTFFKLRISVFSSFSVFYLILNLISKKRLCKPANPFWYKLDHDWVNPRKAQSWTTETGVPLWKTFFSCKYHLHTLILQSSWRHRRPSKALKFAFQIDPDRGCKVFWVIWLRTCGPHRS